MKTLTSKPELFEPKAYVAKIEKRQIEWQWNRPLLLSTLACIVLVALGSFASYQYHTTQASKTHFDRAKAAGESGDLAEQTKWLQRYLLLQPQDVEALVSVAIAADDAVELATPAQRYEATDRARRLLSSSIARLGAQNPDQLNDLRERLIKRLILLGGAWYREAERQVVSLAAEATDPQANRSMAEALVGQVRLARYDSRSADKYDSADDYWNWLSQQKPGEVLIKAIKLNPSDTDLIGSLVELFQQSPEMFAQVDGNAEERDAALAQRVEAMLAGIVANTDAQSLWIRYWFEQQRGQIERADQILLPAAEQAAASLAAAAANEQSGTPGSNPLVDNEGENAASGQTHPATQEPAADQLWDYILLSEAARRVSESEPPRARASYDQLTACRPSAVPASVVESVYLKSGQLMLQQGDADGAIEVWEQGLDVQPTSLDLLSSLAWLQVYQLQTNPALLDPTEFESVTSDEITAAQTGNVDLAIATATLQRFTDAIESLSTQLIQASDTDLPRNAKVALGRRLESARWRARVMRAALATLDNRPHEAIADLRMAIAMTVEVDDPEQIAATLQLAALYQNEAAWDQVAMTLDEAIKRSPANVALRARAADAWAWAGNQNQSLQQWRLTGSSNSIEIQVASIEAQLNDQTRLPSSQQDWSGLRIAIRNAHDQHASAIAQFRAGDATGLGPVASQPIARLEILSVLLPPAGMDADQHWQASDFAAALATLSHQHPGEVARQAAEQSPGDAVAQIVFARTAALAATQPELAETRASLLQQARQAVDTAAAIDGADETSVVSARMVGLVAGGDEAKIRAEIDKLGESKLPEFDRLMLSSQTLVAIKDYEAALTLLKQADEARPSSRTQLALAMLYRQLKRSEDEVAALRRAQQSEPDNPTLRNQLAQALVARDGGEIDWREIEQLLQTAKGGTEVNRFLHAILLATQGQTQQQDQAATILRQIIQERNPRSDDAARALAAIRRRQTETLVAGKATVVGDDNGRIAGEHVVVEILPPTALPPEAERFGNEVRELYDSLTSKRSPEATDLYRYADFLLQLGEAEDLVKVDELLERLKSSPQGALASLEISIRYAQKQGNLDTAPEIIDQWADRVTQAGDSDASNIASVAGASLVRLGFVDQGLRWFQQAYQHNPDVLSNYVITLVQLGRAEQARKLSLSHYDEHQDAGSAMLLSELMLSQPEPQRDPADQQRVDQAVKQFSRNAPLLESVGTLHMQQNDHAAAIDLYQRAHAIEPLRVRTLNNLAMAFSEVPGQEAEGILPIKQAINLAGEIPELLDTKGVVLLKAGQLAEAEQVFRSAIEQQPDEPRF